MTIVLIPNFIRFLTNDEWRRVLRIAVSHKRLTFLEEIVKLMPPAAVIYKTTKAGITTALHVAAMYGYKEAAEILLNGNPRLTQIPDMKGRLEGYHCNLLLRLLQLDKRGQLGIFTLKLKM